MKRTRKEHKNKEYGEQRSRHRHKTSYKDVYCAQYSIDNRDEINRIIRANEFLLQQDIKLTPKDFRRLYNEQKGLRIIVPLADPSINFIERKLQILHTNVLCGFTTLAQKFYCETT